MPHPLELLSSPLSWIVFGLYGGLAALEWLFPGRPTKTSWAARIRGTLAFVLFFFVSSYLPLVWDEKLSEFQVLTVSAWPLGIQVLLGILLYQFIGYGYHRLIHRFDLLFRLVHQTHHSSETIDVPSAYYFHPLDMVGWTLVSSLGLVAVIGLAPEAATVVLLLGSFFSTFQHANLKTPRWLGYFIQRPESHSRHHERGYHRSNYADLPLIDLIFGTFENPADFSEQNGFFEGASTQLWPLLRGVDLSAHPRQKRASHASQVSSFGASRTGAAP